VSDEFIDALAQYVRFLANQMKLRDWEFEVCYDPDLAGSAAKIEITSCRHEAALTISPRFLESSPEEQRYALVHELTHAHLEPLRDTVRTAESLLSQTWPVIQANHDNAVEGAAHKLAACIAPYLPTFQTWLEANRLASHGGGVHEPQQANRRGVHTRKRRR
jgi:hypothetical protein